MIPIAVVDWDLIEPTRFLCTAHLSGEERAGGNAAKCER